MELIEAVILNDIVEAKKLLEAGADPNESLDESALRSLHFAAQNNLLEIGELLIKAGADIYARTVPEAETPLEIAQLHDNKDFIKLLLSYAQDGGADYIN